MNTTRRPRLIAAALAATALVAWACAINPATGQREVSFVSEAQEIQIGQESDPSITAQMGGLYPDEGLQGYVSSLGNELAQVSERPALPWSFKVLDDDLINAFALPGGYIYVTRGILSHMNSEAELAGVLGHEVGHVTARHTARRITRQQIGLIGVVAGAVFSETVRNNAGVAVAALQLLMLRYSRGDEAQSDELGFRYMTRTHHHPAGMSDVMRMLQSTSPSAEEMGIPTWLLSHPDPGNRVEANERRMAASTEDFSGYERNRETFLDRLDGLVFGEDPRQGYFIGPRFLHPTLTFELTFPEGWSTENGALAVQALSGQEDALINLSFAETATAQEGLRTFMAQDGVTPGRTYNRPIHGLPASWGEFTATTEQGELLGLVAFVEHGGNVYQLLGYGAPAQWATRSRDVASTFMSFDDLTDRRYLDVSPHRIRIVRLDRSMSFQEFLGRYPSTVEDEEVRLANQVAADGQLESGRRMKQIVGGRVPTS